VQESVLEYSEEGEGVIQTIKIADIKLREDLYPRIEKSPQTIQKYAEVLEVLPPIEINQNNELIDGWHRLMAYQKNGETEIPVIITQTKSDTELLELAIERNAKFGLQLSQDDKMSLARRIYHATTPKDREAKKKHLASILSIPERTMRTWLSRIDKDERDLRDRRIFDLWMACHTQEEIADRVGITQQAVAQVLQETAKLPSLVKLHNFASSDVEGVLKKALTKERVAAAEHATDFETPIYNVWKFKKKNNQVNHFGNTEVTIVDNLLYLYTNPFDVVVDPFGGGGSTIDICKKRLRRYWVSDRKPAMERQDEIRTWDITDGLPALPRWEPVKLVYLDPPYWKQAEGEYSDDPKDLGNMPLKEFNDTLAGLIKKFGDKMPSPSYIALILQPTQWNAPERHYTDHIADMLRMVKLPIDIRFQCPYESQQCTPQMVEWAKENRKCLALSRELVVWRV